MLSDCHHLHFFRKRPVTGSHHALACNRKADLMDQAYWLRRKRASVVKANKATSARARLAHFELAGRYSIKAADAAPSPNEADNDQ